jgi:hypothetical protein
MSEESKEIVETKEENKIPYYKFKKVEDKLADALKKLDDLDKKKQVDKETGLKEQGKFKELSEKKDKEIDVLKEKLKTAEKIERQNKINSLILREIKKSDPQDENDILKAIDEGKLTIIEKEEGISIDGINTEIELIKEKKPWLFKSEKPNDNLNPDENKKTKVNTESIETEFRALSEKQSLTLQENLKFQKLGEQLSELREGRE